MRLFGMVPRNTRMAIAILAQGSRLKAKALNSRERERESIRFLIL